MKRILSILLLITIAFTLTACGSKSKETGTYKSVDMTVACLKGPTGLGMAKLMKDNEGKKTANNYKFTVATSPDEISGKIVTGEINIASVPTNLAAKLYNKTNGKVKMLAVNTLGVLSIIENGNSIKTAADLKGKTIYATGEGSNPEYILKEILKDNKFQVGKDVNITFVASNDELTAAIVSGKAQVAMVSEPVASVVLSKKGSLRRALSLNDEWEKKEKGKLMMGCVVALDSFINTNKSAVDKFLEEYKKSIDFAINSTDEAAKYCAEFQIVPSEEIAKASIPNSNLTFIKGNEIQKSIENYFNVLTEFDQNSLGGKLPQKDFYYEK